ncbi:MAG: DUF5606 domain-containing protein [Chitinophagaceae bacterium]
MTGLPGLFELINSKTDGAIVRSLDDKSTRFVSSRIHNFSHLESIEVYTVRDNVNLVDVFNAMDKAGGSLPDDKDANAVKKYFEKAYPDMDFERVYTSDMKKMVKWFEILKKNNVEIKLELNCRKKMLKKCRKLLQKKSLLKKLLPKRKKLLKKQPKLPKKLQERKKLNKINEQQISYKVQEIHLMFVAFSFAKRKDYELQC